MIKLHRREDGDTIIEVLICLAILTLVLGGAYYSSSMSYRNDLDSQEHSEALTVAQSQLEELRAFSGTIPATTFCMNTVGGLAASTDCKLEPNTNVYKPSCPRSLDFCYNITINEASTTPMTVTNQSSGDQVNVYLNSYKINVSWPSLGGNGNDDVSLYYRVDTES